MFTWTPEMSVGVKQLDEQHQHLFQEVNVLLQHVEQGLGVDPIHDHQLLDNIMNYNFFHIKHEEELMETFDCKSEAHLSMHHAYITQVKDLFLAASNAVRAQLPEAADHCKTFAVFAGSWHVQHILKMDTTYTVCFHEHGLS